MYFSNSGNEFDNNLLVMSGIFKTKKNSLERTINILEGTGNKFKYFLEQKLNFLAFNQT